MINLTDEQQAKLRKIHRLYMFDRSGEAYTPEDMLDMILAFVDQHDEEFESYLKILGGAGRTNDDPDLARQIDAHITHEWE